MTVYSRTLPPCPGQDEIWGDLIHDFEALGRADYARAWAERLCKEGRYHHGAVSRIGALESGKPVTEEWSCWNCKFRVKRTTTLTNGDAE